VDAEQFSIIQSICRMGLGPDGTPFRHQVERLEKAFRASGEIEKAEALLRLLKAQAQVTSIQPSRVVVSPAFAGAETLSEKTQVPVDRETAAPLAEVFFPGTEIQEIPILDANVAAAVNSIVTEWSNFERLKEFGVPPATSCLLYGLPGTGKTKIAYSIASRLGLPLVSARLDGLVSSFLGTTARNIANLFRFAARYNCVLLLDEFDAIAKVRDDPQEIGEIKRVVNSVLQNIDLRKDKGITIAITNHDQLLDSAVWRRFEIRVQIPIPGFEERRLIATKYFDRLSLSETERKFIAWISEGMTGADIETMAKNAKRYLALNTDSSLIPALRHHWLTHAGRESAKHRKTLLMPTDQLIAFVRTAPDMDLSQKDLASLFQTNQTKIARVLKRNQPVAA
jgi:hypothetical protein